MQEASKSVDPENLIRYLTEVRGLTTTKIAEGMGMDRNTLNSKRRTEKRIKLEALAQQILKAYPNEFPDGKIPEHEEGSESEISIMKKYILLLERNLARVEAENAELRKRAGENWSNIVDNI